MQTFARKGRRVRFYIEDDWYIEPAEPWRMDVLVEDDQPEDSPFSRSARVISISGREIKSAISVPIPTTADPIGLRR